MIVCESMRRIDRISWVALGLLLMCVPASVPALQSPAKKEVGSIPVESYAAIVNDRVILMSDVLMALAPVEAELRKKYQGRELMKQLTGEYGNTLTNLVDRALILEEFDQMGTPLPDRAGEDHMDEVIRGRFDNRTELLNILTAEQTTLDEYKEQLREQLVIQLMRRDHLLNNLATSPADVRSLYEEHMDRYLIPAKVKLWMISIARGTTGEEPQEKEARAREARARLLNGETFAVVAKELSEGNKAHDGGDWGWRNPLELRPEIAKEIEKTSTGEISELLGAGGHFYIFLIEKRKNGVVVPFAEARQELEQELREKEITRLSKEWLSRLRKKHFIKIFTEE